MCVKERRTETGGRRKENEVLKVISSFFVRNY